MHVQALLLYDALTTRFTRVRLRPRRPDCAACSPAGELRGTDGGPSNYDYAAFTGGHAPVEGGVAEGSAGAAPGPGRITAQELAVLLGWGAGCGGGGGENGRGAADARAAVDGGGGGGAVDGVCGSGTGGEKRGGGAGVVLVDVRPRELYAATRIPGSVHVAMREVRSALPCLECRGCGTLCLWRRCTA